MTRCPGCGSWSHFTGRLATAVEQLELWPEFAERLDVNTLAILTVWTHGTSAVIRAEAERRHAHHQAAADQLAAAIKNAEEAAWYWGEQ